MQVMDIVNRAAMNCGVAPSFNADEVPEDIQARASDIFRHEIVPKLNCDRAIDITETVYTANPSNRVFVLRPTPLDYEFYIMGQVPETYRELIHKARLREGAFFYDVIRQVLERNGYIYQTTPDKFERTKKWPSNQLGIPEQMMVWSSDNKLVNVSKQYWFPDELEDELLDKRYNIPFNPMYVESVVRASDGVKMTYVHAEELISSEYKYSQLAYTIESYYNTTVIKFAEGFGDTQVQLVLPVPIKIVNSLDEPNPWQGTVLAPEKFRGFLIDKLAYRLAVEYGLQTAGAMSELAKESYQAIIKNVTKRYRPQDINNRINSYIRTSNGKSGNMGGTYGGL